MRSSIVAFGIALLLACILHEIPVPASAPLPVSTSGVELRTISVMHEDGYIGEMNMGNTSRPTGLATQIRDGMGARDGISFPVNANN